ncbi:ABC transporter ATP-binding protein [Spirillospora sp. NPDC050679]
MPPRVRARRVAAEFTEAVTAVVRLAWRASPRLLVLVLALAVLSAAVLPVSLLVLRTLVGAFARGDRATGTTAAAVLVALAGANHLVTVVMAMRQEQLAARISLTAEQELLTLAGRVPLERFHDAAWYDAVARAREGVTWRPALALGTLVGFVSEVTGLAGMVGIIAGLDPVLVVFAVLAAVPLLVDRRWRARALYRVRKETTGLERRRDYFRELVLRADLAKDIRGYGLAGTFGRGHRDAAEQALAAELAVQRRGVRTSALAGVLGAAPLLAAYLLLGARSGGGEVPPGTLFLVCVAFTALTTGLVDFFGVMVDLEDNAVYLTDYFALIDAGPGPEAPRPQVPAGPPRPVVRNGPPLVEFRDVWYAYPDHPPTLRGLSLTVEAGRCVALMGRNGAGKSTVVKLLMGLLHPQRGAVLLDGTDLRDLPAEQIRARFGVLFQEYGRYELSLAEAVALGRPDRPLDADAVGRALRGAGLDGLARSLPDGTDALVGREFPGARDLSGGQWQRLALARVLYRDAPVWVLDEPTAALDIEGEARFLSGLADGAAAGRSVLVVTHRLETARAADRVLVLREGRLAEEGTHEQLLELNGEYASYHEATPI